MRTWAIPTIAMVNVWRHMGYTALLVFAGLQTIPTTSTRRRRSTAAPSGSRSGGSPCRCCGPILALVLVITVTGSFQVFDTVAVTTKGGPGNASRVIQYYIYQKGFAEGQFGYASALSVILFIILATVALVQLRLLRRRRVRPGLRGNSYGNHNRPLVPPLQSRQRHRRPGARRSISAEWPPGQQ